jgi:PAS domain S-box-containing protein
LVFANDSFKKRFEYSEDELFDLKLSDLLAEGCLPENEGVTKTKVVTNFESVFHSKSGKRIYLEGSVLLEYKNGFFEGSMGFFNDVTEKKKLQESLIASELKFRNFFNLAPIPIWVTDPETFKFVLVNKAALMHYGYTENEFLSMTYMDIRGKQDLPTKGFLCKKGDCIGSGNSKNYMSSFTHVKKCGEKINVEIYTSPIDINERQGILCVAIDVTERNEFENKITKAIIKTQEDERYEIGCELHDNVCQILAAAKMSLGMIKPSLVPNAVQSYNKSYEAINLATNEIRNLSHRLAPAFFDDTKLEEAFKSLLKSFNIIDAYKVSVYFDKSSKERLISQDIKLNLYRILQEQLRNIVEHAHCSIIEVSVFIFDNYLHMRIADNGAGFNKNLVQYGIGMANMKRRAELFGGKLYVQSKKDEGCEVLVKIPVEKLN